jgi:hypothetical protein
MILSELLWTQAFTKIVSHRGSLSPTAYFFRFLFVCKFGFHGGTNIKDDKNIRICSIPCAHTYWMTSYSNVFASQYHEFHTKREKKLAPLTLFICYKHNMRSLITMSRTLLLEIGIQGRAKLGMWRIMPTKANCPEFFKQSMGARNRVGIGLLFRPARLHRMAESIPGNRFLGSLKV